MRQPVFKKSISAVFLAFAYIFLLVHSFVPHHHDFPAGSAKSVHEHPGKHHSHDNSQHESDQQEPVADPNHLLSNHQHAFGDNSAFHPETSASVSITKKQIDPLVICALSLFYPFSEVEDSSPPPADRLNLSSGTFGRSHALRGPPVS